MGTELSHNNGRCKMANKTSKTTTKTTTTKTTTKADNVVTLNPKAAKVIAAFTQAGSGRDSALGMFLAYCLDAKVGTAEALKHFRGHVIASLADWDNVDGLNFTQAGRKAFASLDRGHELRNLYNGVRGAENHRMTVDAMLSDKTKAGQSIRASVLRGDFGAVEDAKIATGTTRKTSPKTKAENGLKTFLAFLAENPKAGRKMFASAVKSAKLSKRDLSALVS